jgi:hypothetical protein
MPWKECYKMDERMRFVARLMEGEKMAGKMRFLDYDLGRLSINAQIIRNANTERTRMGFALATAR